MKIKQQPVLSGSIARSRGGAPTEPVGFRYDVAFSRNLGWVTEDEQERLRRSRVAIAGMGGVGGVHLQTLARLGVGGFSIADLDTFELGNMNRQAGASMAALGRPKVEVMAEQARAINPELELCCFAEGVHDGNLDAFLSGADVYVDGLDFFALEIRRKVFRRARELGIPAVTAAPLGMGTGYLLFTPDGMSFDDYFQLEGLSSERQAARFAVGLAPSGLMIPYLADPTCVDLKARRTPSTPMGCFLAAGVAGTEVLKLILGRGALRPAPLYHHFDAYRGRWVSRRRGGLTHRLKVWAFERRLAGLSSQAEPATSPASPASDALPHELREILREARWAPSGDNAQPWTFEHTGGDELRLWIRDQNGQDVYDVQGQPTLIAGGALLESIRVAATRHGRALSWAYLGREGHVHELRLALPRAGVAADPRLESLVTRATDRRPYRLKPLEGAQREALEEALGDVVEPVWHTSARDRLRLALLHSKSGELRFKLPEAIEVHQRVIDWKGPRSRAGIPGSALGCSRVSQLAVRWMLGSGSRMRLAQRLPGASWLPRLEMDVWPSLACAGHVAFRVPEGVDPADPQTLLRVGERLQRFWLEVTRQGLAFQPGLAPLIFAHYARHDVPFSSDPGSQRRAARLAKRVERLFPQPDRVVFLGRVGTPRSPLRARSARRELAELVQASPASDA
jgi:molybdopterin/thiamine biosynthesis adenylyltransferase/nitroreductase